MDGVLGMVEFICTVKTPAAVGDAIYTGADSISFSLPTGMTYQDHPKNHFRPVEVETSVRLAHDAGARVYVAIDSYAPVDATEVWKEMLSLAETAAVDAVILTEIPMLDYAKAHHPRLRLHTAMPIAAATPQVVSFYANLYGVRRIALPIIDLGCFREIFPDGFPIETEALVLGHSWTPGGSHPRQRSARNAGSRDETVRSFPAGRLSLESSLSWLSADVPSRPAEISRPLTLWQKRPSGSARSPLGYGDCLLEPRKLAAHLRRARTTSLNIGINDSSKETIRDIVAALRHAIDGEATRH